MYVCILTQEVIESQLRKLQMENSSLQSENKLLKEKVNRANGEKLIVVVEMALGTPLLKISLK